MVGFLLRGIGIADEPLSLSQYPRQWTTTAFSGLKRTNLTPPLNNTRLTSHCRGMEALAVKGVELPVGGVAKPHRSFEYCVEHRDEITRRGVDDLQHLGGRSLAGEPLVEPLTQLRVGTPKFDYLIVERRGHVLLRPTPSRSYDTRVSSRLHARSCSFLDGVAQASARARPQRSQDIVGGRAQSLFVVFCRKIIRASYDQLWT